MKRSLLSIFFLLIVTLAAVAQPRISSNKETHNFGQIEWKRPVTVEYTITNTGNLPLVLTNVTTSCACAVADWTKEPIAPGAKGIVYFFLKKIIQLFLLQQQELLQPVFQLLLLLLQHSPLHLPKKAVLDTAYGFSDLHHIG